MLPLLLTPPLNTQVAPPLLLLPRHSCRHEHFLASLLDWSSSPVFSTPAPGLHAHCHQPWVCKQRIRPCRPLLTIPQALTVIRKTHKGWHERFLPKLSVEKHPVLLPCHLTGSFKQAPPAGAYSPVNPPFTASPPPRGHTRQSWHALLLVPTGASSSVLETMGCQWETWPYSSSTQPEPCCY